MNARSAKPGKPGHWNGKKQRWRTYVRTFRRIDPDAASRIAEKEIAMKARLVRIEAFRRWARVALIASLAAGLLVAQWLVVRYAARGAATVEVRR